MVYSQSPFATWDLLSVGKIWLLKWCHLGSSSRLNYPVGVLCWWKDYFFSCWVSLEDILASPHVKGRWVSPVGNASTGHRFLSENPIWKGGNSWWRKFLKRNLSNPYSWQVLCFCFVLFLGTPKRWKNLVWLPQVLEKITNCKGRDSKKTSFFPIYCTIFIIDSFCIFCFLLCNLITGAENDVIFAPLSSCQKSTYVGVLVYHLASTSHNGFFTASI